MTSVPQKKLSKTSGGKLKKIIAKKTAKPSVKKTKVTKVVPKQTTTWHEFYVKKEDVPVTPGSSITGIEKVAQSRSSDHVFYRVRTFVGWMFVVVGLVGIVSLVSSTAERVSNSTSSIFSKKAGQVSLFGSAPEQTPEPKEEVRAAQEGDIKITATGDILFARHVETQMRKRKDYTWPFKNVAAFLNDADLTFGNLETSILPGGTTPVSSTTFRADPASIDGLAYAGFDAVSVANNHTMNFKAPGLLMAIDELKKRNIAAVGGGKNQNEAHTPFVTKVKGKTIAIYAYDDPNIPGYQGFATEKDAGIAKMDIEAMQNDVRNAKKYSDYVIVSMHAGIEYKALPNDFQKNFAHAAIDAGATMVIGAHPHVVESVERYGNGIIMYSLGNFVFDQYFSPEVKTGLVAKLTIDEDGVPHAVFYPTLTENLSVQPRILEGEERTEMLQKLHIPEQL